MTGRVWAPVRATIDPDRVVLALLEAGDDPEKDLGAALLAVHRAGAAACQVVAAAPVPDEVALIRTLAECRGRVAPAVAECVSKSVDDPKYAHLLTRDVFDDAEQAALTLFRACVAKGVSPPLACQRVGHVFGVPREDLGRYFALATNPATGAVALVDAADRALLAHVAKVARSETEDTKVTISKAPAREEYKEPPTQVGDAGRKPPPRGGGLVGADREDFNRKHPRNADGEFAEVAGQPETRMDQARRLLGMGPSAPRVADSPAVAPKRAVTPDRPARPSRPNRPKRAEPEASAPKAKPVGAPKAKLVALPEPRANIQAMSAIPKAKLIQPEPKQPQRPGKQLVDAPDVQIAKDLLETKEDPNAGTYHELLGVKMSVSVPVADGQTFMRQMVGKGRRGEPFIFRMRHLINLAGDMELDGSPDALHHREIAAQYQWDKDDHQNEPIIHRIPGVSRFNKKEDDLIKEVTRNLSREVVMTDQGPEYRYDEEKLDLLKVYQDTQSEDTLVVQYQPVTPGDPVKQVIVDEFVVEGTLFGGAIGRLEGNKQHPEIILDPNQAYQVLNELPDAYFDTFSNTVVHRWKLAPIDEDDVQRIAGMHRVRRGKGDDVGKAAREEFRPRPVADPAFEATVNRDAEGRFAEEEETVTRPARPGRPAQPNRPNRPSRPARPVTRTQAPTPLARPMARLRLSAPTARPTAKPLTRGLTAHLVEPGPGRPELPVLHDDRRYHVLSEEAMARIRENAYASSDGMALLLGGRAQEALYGTDVYLGNKAATVLRDNVGTMVAQREGNARSKPLFRVPNRTEDDMYNLGVRINQEFDARPGLAEVYIEEVGGGMVQVWGNHYAVAKQHLIELEEGTNFDDDELELVYLGEAKSKDMLLRGRDSWPLLTMNEDEALIQKPFNAPLSRYVLRTADVERWRAGRAD